MHVGALSQRGCLHRSARGLRVCLFVWYGVLKRCLGWSENFSFRLYGEELRRGSACLC